MFIDARIRNSLAVGNWKIRLVGLTLSGEKTLQDAMTDGTGRHLFQQPKASLQCRIVALSGRGEVVGRTAPFVSLPKEKQVFEIVPAQADGWDRLEAAMDFVLAGERFEPQLFDSPEAVSLLAERIGAPQADAANLVLAWQIGKNSRDRAEAFAKLRDGALLDRETLAMATDARPGAAGSGPALGKLAKKLENRKRVIGAEAGEAEAEPDLIDAFGGREGVETRMTALFEAAARWLNDRPALRKNLRKQGVASPADLLALLGQGEAAAVLKAVENVPGSKGVKADEVDRLQARLPREKLAKHLASSARKNKSKSEAGVSEARLDAVRADLDRRFPADSFIARLRDPATARRLGFDHATVANALDHHDDFDIETDNIPKWFRQRGMDTTQDRRARDELMRAQRLYRLGGSPAHAEALADARLASARAIARLAEPVFVARMQHAGLNEQEARAIHGRAEAMHARAATLAGEMRSLGHGQGGGVMQQLDHTSAAALADAFPDMATLFGSGNVCSCAWCRKLGSPAAYVVDALDFLGARTAVDGVGGLVDPKTVLMGLRADIARVDLSCDNTLIEFPHIDLIIELLGDMIAPEPAVNFAGPIAAGAPSASLIAAITGAGWPAPSSKATVHPPASPAAPIWALRDRSGVYHIEPQGGGYRITRTRQTLKTAPELRAQPEYPNPLVDPVLEAAEIGFGLPYAQKTAAVRSLLLQAGSSRLALMQALRRDGLAVPSDNLAAGERLGLDDAQRAMIATPGAAVRLRSVFGTGGVDAAVALKNVARFMAAAGTTFAEVQALLRTQYINPRNAAAQVTIKDIGAEPSCDPATKELTGLAEGADGTLDRMQRLLRLFRHVDWRLADLDAAIAAPRIGSGRLDEPALRAIAALADLATITGAPVERLVPAFGRVDDVGEDGRLESSLYARMFLVPGPSGTVEPAFQLDAIMANEALAPGNPARLQFFDRTDAIAFAIGATPDNIGDLATRAAARLGADGAAITRHGLAELAAYPTLARAFALTLDELLDRIDLIGVDPVSGPQAALDFHAEIETLATSGLSPADARYYAGDVATDIDLRRISDDAIVATLTGLQAQYLTTQLANPSAYDATADLATNLAALRAAGDAAIVPVGATLATLSEGKTAIGGVAASTVLADFVAANLVDPDLGEIAGTSGLEALRAAIVTSLAGAGGDPTNAAVIAARGAFVQSVLDLLAAHRRRADRKTAVLQTIADRFQVSADMARALGGTRLKSTLGAGARARQLMQLVGLPLVDASVSPPAAVAITEVAFPRGYEALRLLDKLAAFAKSLSLKPADLTAMCDVVPPGWFEPDTMKVGTVGAAQSYARVARLLRGLALQRSRQAAAQPAPAAPFDYWTIRAAAEAPAATAAQVLTPFAAWAGADLATLTDLDAWFGISAGGVSTGFADPVAFSRLETAATLLAKLRIDRETGVLLVAPSPTAAAVTAMTAALRRSYDDATWLQVLGSINDPLRLARRDAMVAWLIGTRPEFREADDLFERLLLDPQMDTKRNLSRVVAAHESIQMFVTRVRMGSQPVCIADETVDPKWKQWNWMNHYRVYEAAMTVFCHPQDYLEADLRDDVSPFFQALMDDLNQGELNDDLVENATANYLEKLDQAARLEVVATHYQADGVNATHVLARTEGGDPAQYFVRSFKAEREWTPWVRVDLEISSDQVILFTRRGRLSVAWLVFAEEADREQAQPIPTVEAEKQTKRWRIQLATSDFDGRKWSTRRISRKALTTSWSKQPLYAKAGFRLATSSPATIASVFASRSPAEFLAKANSGDTDVLMVSYDFSAGHEGQADETHDINDVQIGGFSLSGCSGAPEPFEAVSDGLVYLPQFKDSAVRDMRFTERDLDADNDLAIAAPGYALGAYRAILRNTPDNDLQPLSRFRVAWPMQMALIDFLIALILSAIYGAPIATLAKRRLSIIPLGSFMPFFFTDLERAYVAVPGLYKRREARTGSKFDGFTYTDMNLFVTEGFTLLVLFLELMDHAPPADQEQAAKDFFAAKRFQTWLGTLLSLRGSRFRLRFRNFHHPHVCFLRTVLARAGVPGLINRANQDRLSDFVFEAPAQYAPAGIVLPDYPVEDIDFTPDGAYSGYNWELFFHLPWLIGTRLSRAGKYADAKRWLQLVFDPGGASSDPAPARYWVTKPFRELSSSDYAAQRIEAIIYDSAARPGGVGLDPTIANSISVWRDDPFNPFALARTRIVAFQRAMVRQTAENLIAWADSEFSIYQRENIDFAEQLYVGVQRMLGKKDEVVPPSAEPTPMCFAQLDPLTDLLGNAMIGLENLVSTDPMPGAPPLTLGASVGMPYFCTPTSSRMDELRDLVAGRLFNIRHSRNIDGIDMPVSLFAPPIDPMALVRARAAGLSIADLLAGYGAPLPFYRFQTLLTTARNFALEVRALSAALLSALENGDAERLAVLRNRHEKALAEATMKVKQAHIDECAAQLDVLDSQKRTAEFRLDFYRNRAFMSPAEIAAVVLNGLSLIPNAAATGLQFGAAAVHAAPNAQIGASGVGGSPHASIVWGSSNISGMMASLAAGLNGVGGLLSTSASITSTIAGYLRRKEEWDFNAAQEDLRLKEIAKQRVGAEIRLQMAQADLAATKLQVANAAEVGDFLSGKFTNAALYDWMVGRLASVHYRAFKLAEDQARRASRCLQAELGIADNLIQGNYWDGVHKGLLAGDLLLQDINAMESLYLAKNVRRRELTKTISLAELDPFALEELRSTGKCAFSLPEAIFDMDHPGHYFRRIKTVALTVPCIAAADASIASRLTLTMDRYRKSEAAKPGAQPWQCYAAQPDDDRFVTGSGGVQSIATSTAQNDSGTFELRLGDERYLPFENAGTESSWVLEFNTVAPGFDFRTITDAKMILRYTAIEGKGDFRTLVEGALIHNLEEMALANARQGLLVAIDLRRDLPFEWKRLKDTGAATISLDQQRLPWVARVRGATVAQTALLARADASPSSLAVTAGGAALTLGAIGGAPYLETAFSNAFTPAVGAPATITVPAPSERAALTDLILFAKLDLA